MRATLRTIGLVIGVGGLLYWAAAGANLGWTKTSVPIKVIDEVTEIETTRYEPRFVPGIEFVASTLTAPAVFLTFSLLVGRTKQMNGNAPGMNKNAVAVLTFLTVVSQALAAPQVFDFKDPKGVNSVDFRLDAPLEAISGNANGVSGTVTFDPEKPAATKGKIVINTASLHVPNPMMREHLHGAQWMDVKNHPEIVFDVTELRDVKATAGKITANAVGKMTTKGVTRDLVAPISLAYLPGKLGQRMPKMEGDLLVIRSSITIQRKDFGINPGAPRG